MQDTAERNDTPVPLCSDPGSVSGFDRGMAGFTAWCVRHGHESSRCFQGPRVRRGRQYGRLRGWSRAAPRRHRFAIFWSAFRRLAPCPRSDRSACSARRGRSRRHATGLADQGCADRDVIRTAAGPAADDRRHRRRTLGAAAGGRARDGLGELRPAGPRRADSFAAVRRGVRRGDERRARPAGRTATNRARRALLPRDQHDRGERERRNEVARLVQGAGVRLARHDARRVRLRCGGRRRAQPIRFAHCLGQTDARRHRV